MKSIPNLDYKVLMSVGVQKHASSNKGWISFSECEHDGDLDTYIEDLTRSGAKILDRSVDEDSEEGKVFIEVEDINSFKEKFKKTKSFDFSSLGGY